MLATLAGLVWSLFSYDNFYVAKIVYHTAISVWEMAGTLVSSGSA